MRIAEHLITPIALAGFIACFPGPMHAQEPEDAGYLRFPRPTSSGIVCTNNFGSALYLFHAGNMEELLTGPGIAAEFSLSPSGMLVGIKLIDEEGLQVPAVFDLATRQVRPLHEPVRRAGQVSFADDGRIAFTVGEQLIVTDGVASNSYDLGYYANLAPVSPDGRSVAWNDADDQIWILTLATGERRKVSDGRAGYCRPAWAPAGSRLLFCALNGTMHVHDIGIKKTFDLGTGSSPSWAGDGRSIVYALARSGSGRLQSSDLYRVGYDGSAVVRLTDTPEILEMDPCLMPDGGVLYHTFTGQSIEVLPPDAAVASDAGRTVAALPSATRIRPQAPPARIESALDIPYVHQVYDTPDWFNGHWACAPTQSIMVLAYYHMLPRWDIVCSTPGRHVTSWGNYVADHYRFREVEYSLQAADPNGKPGQGGYGFMWFDPWSPHSRMADYFRNHGMTATQTEGTPYSTAAAEIAAGYPFSMCVLLTTSGHLVLAHGFGSEPHTLVFNDPYGDKNRGYMNYYGKNVQYDWPGYNNGYQNLNEVAWCIATRPPALAWADSIVDDLQFDGSFSLTTGAPAKMLDWKDMKQGYNSHFWYAYTRVGVADTCSATWRPQIPREGMYEVAAYIPFSNATEARYVVTHANGQQPVVLNQKAFHNAWVPLGIFPFSGGTAGSLRLGDASSTGGQELVFDAVRWSYRGGTTGIGNRGDLPRAFALEPNYPNPFNPSTTIRYALPVDAGVKFEVMNMLGEVVDVLEKGPRHGGLHSATWVPHNLPSGVYFARLTAIDNAGAVSRATRQMLLLK